MTTCITVMGTGLALRGPDGSMVRAVEGRSEMGSMWPNMAFLLIFALAAHCFALLSPQACTTRGPSSSGTKILRRLFARWHALVTFCVVEVLWHRDRGLLLQRGCDCLDQDRGLVGSCRIMRQFLESSALLASLKTTAITVRTLVEDGSHPGLHMHWRDRLDPFFHCGLP